jgi:hypothetical protein
MEKNIEEEIKRYVIKYPDFNFADAKMAYYSNPSFKKYIDKKMKMTPEELMKEGFEYLSKTRECFEKAKAAYDSRANFVKADPKNAANVKSALHFLAAAYDEVSSIWENDMD